ncbi:THAP domain-containing protein 2-like isoform X2 [Kryptolebias marmoratus]|uniref:THAP domain-containing protein 2-like isoform X2 n=1 Tax=Kryptolebias marmoratus TaxID=37003 RepID=UPI0018ACF12D|nr:THAP domain-containing protein 2-like isoform X2 [Kryptolebias marmoratus]
MLQPARHFPTAELDRRDVLSVRQWRRHLVSGFWSFPRRKQNMPDFCAAYGCSNERNEKTKKLGVTFHRFPNDKERRQAWTTALRRKGFQPKDRTVVCSCHFKPEDFDRTRQTTRLKEGAVPSVFKFPNRLSKLGPSSSSRTSLTAENRNKFPRQRSRSPVRELSLRNESTSPSPSSPSRAAPTGENGNKFPRSPVRDQLGLREESTSMRSPVCLRPSEGETKVG